MDELGRLLDLPDLPLPDLPLLLEQALPFAQILQPSLLILVVQLLVRPHLLLAAHPARV